MSEPVPDLPSKMKAWLYTRTTGGIENNLHLSSCARTPGTTLRRDQLLIRVIATSLNPADYKVPEAGHGLLSRLIITRPASPGLDFCGRVVATGPGSAEAEFQPGQLVYGCLAIPSQFGALAEYVVSSVENTVLLPSSSSSGGLRNLDTNEAATIGVAGQTAYQSIATYVTPGFGDRVFINGGSGGVGTFGIQIAKNVLGCHVTVSCSSRNVQLCKDLGADEVIDYTAVDLVQTLKEKGQVFSVVVDNVGSPPELYRECHHFLLPGRKFVQVGSSSPLVFADRLLRPRFVGGGRRQLDIMILNNNKGDLVRIGEWMREGKVKAVIDSTYEFEDAVKALEKLKSGRARGKIVVYVAENP
ncbi:hypothetical protein VTN00DRAFT_5141 [Thermoascus crustaceus]|uniref:uncharacterized protein n=1 Tax=Thermoascus crustaceus TaxID=5088 RepID=UPI003742A924